MKKIIAFLVVGVMVLSISACSSSKNKSEEPTGSELSKIIEETSGWTLDQLVEAAQNEASAEGAGNFMVYAPTSRIQKVLDAFNETYGIQGEYYNESGQDLYTKLTTELEANTKDTADVVLLQDSYLFQTQMRDYNYTTNYIPELLKDKINEADQEPLVCYYYNKLFIYNNTDGTTGFSNVWQFTEDAVAGKLFMKDISKESVNKNFLAMLTSDEWSQKLSDAYKDYYGSDIVLDDDCKNAGYQFIKKLLTNVTFGSGDGDIATELSDGLGGNIGLFVYSKLRDDSVDQSKLSEVAYQEEPIEGFAGFMYPMYLQTITGTDRPYTAMLFTYFMMTKDGFCAGFQAGSKDIGTYSTNSDVTPLDGDKELSFWKDCLVIEDPAYLPIAYSNGIFDFITYCSNK